MRYWSKNNGGYSRPWHQLSITERIAAWVVILALCFVALGCLEKIKLPEPERIPANQTVPVQPSKVDSHLKDYASDMFRRVSIKFAPDVQRKKYDPKIWKCLYFLVSQFGPSIYQGRVALVITANPTDNGKMAWSDKRRKDRTITLHEFNLLPTELHILVHEFFHAFYQTNAFIKANPDFIVEGLAVYAENKFRYHNKNNKQILRIMREQSKALDSIVDDRFIDFDKPFTQGSNLFYILSGRLFFSQNPPITKKKIRKILIQGNSFNKRKNFKELAVAYRLKISESFFRNLRIASWNLPEPTSTRHGTFAKSSTKKPYVQIMFSRNKNTAKKTAEALKKKKYPAEVRRDEQSGGYYVLVGPYQDRQDAEKVKKELLVNSNTPRDILVKDFATSPTTGAESTNFSKPYLK